MNFLYQLLLLPKHLIASFFGLLGIGFLIGFHELGHFLFCKLFKVHTPTFSIGFGPTIFSRKIGSTNFVLAPIPLGGYVEIAGSHEVGQGEQKEAQAAGPHSFASKPYYQKLLIMLGGILFNLLFAYTAFIGLFLVGLPKSPFLYPLNATTTVESVGQGSPLQPGDKITSVDETPVSSGAQLFDIIRTRGGSDQTFQVERGEATIDIQVPIQEKKSATGLVGGLDAVLMMHKMPSRGLIGSITSGIRLTNVYIHATVASLIAMITNRKLKGVGGPIMVISQTIKGAAQGPAIFFILLAIISINLAMLNLVPLPILDGGQILFCTIEAVIRRPLSPTVKYGIHLASWILIMGLILFLSINDLMQVADPYIESIKRFLGLGA